MSVGIVLSGGGSRGDFEVGAVQYLYEVRGVRPNVLSGTSVGAINAAKLAEGEYPADPSRGLRGLQSIWNELRVNQDMWETQDWYANIGEDAMKALAAGITTGIGLSVGLFVPVFMPLTLLYLLITGASDLSRFANDLEQASTAKSLYNMEPVKRKLRDPARFRPDRVASSDIALRLSMVSLESGLLRYVTEDGIVLERDGSPVLVPGDYAPECQAIADQLELLVTERLMSQDYLENPPSGSTHGDWALETGRLSHEIMGARAALSACEAQHPRQLEPMVVSLVEAVMASAAIPVAFPPVKLDNENYVDGGARDIVPIEAAVQAGATHVYVVSASAAAVPLPRSMLDGHLVPNFDQSNILDITNRVALDIMTSEIAGFKMDPPNGWGIPQLVVIEPDFDLHDIMTIDPGLIRMRMSHGYMRADDALKAYDQDPSNYRSLTETFSASRNTTNIIKLRRAIWEAEYAANGWRFSLDEFGRPKVVDASDQIARDETAMASVRSMKRQLKALVDQRLAAGGLCPPDADKWWLEWEKHTWTPVRQLWDPSFYPLRHLQVTVDQTTIPLGVPVSLLVTATDAGAPVNGAAVMVDGQQAGVTGTRFTRTFARHMVQVFDPETRRYYPEEVDPVVTVRGDRQVYFEERVDCGFFDAVLDAQIISQSVPATMTTGQSAAATITVKNTGNMTWTPAAGYRLGSQAERDNTTWGTNRINLPGSVAPGAQVTLSFNVSAPATAGSYAFQWQMVLEGVQWFGPVTPAVTIVVSAPAVLTAQFISQSVPASMAAGQTVPVSMVLQNTGNVTWMTDTGFKLGSQSPSNNTTWGTNRISLPGPVAPGAQVTFSFNVTVPSATGSYAFQWQMLQDGYGWFGALTPKVTVAVVAPVYSAQFVSQSVPVSTRTKRGMPVQITMKNTGNVTWLASAGYKLGSQSPQDNTIWGTSRINLPKTVVPGDTVTFSATLAAPALEDLYTFQWQMLQEGVRWFGPLTPAVTVEVFEFEDLAEDAFANL